MSYYPMPTPTPKLEERFWQGVVAQNGCWIWQKQVEVGGYGRFNIGGKQYRAHRFAYFAYYGIDPGEKHVCHGCDQTLCVNPFHLWLGTARDNMRDCLEKGRRKRALNPQPRLNRGMGHRTKLTKEQVLEIRSQQSRPFRSLAREYDLHHSTVSDIMRRKIWKRI